MVFQDYVISKCGERIDFHLTPATVIAVRKKKNCRGGRRPATDSSLRKRPRAYPLRKNCFHQPAKGISSSEAPYSQDMGLQSHTLPLTLQKGSEMPYPLSEVPSGLPIQGPLGLSKTQVLLSSPLPLDPFGEGPQPQLRTQNYIPSLQAEEEAAYVAFLEISREEATDENSLHSQKRRLRSAHFEYLTRAMNLSLALQKSGRNLEVSSLQSRISVIKIKFLSKKSDIDLSLVKYNEEAPHDLPSPPHIPQWRSHSRRSGFKSNPRVSR